MKKDIEQELKEFLVHELSVNRGTETVISADSLKHYAKNKSIDLTGCRTKKETAVRIAEHLSADEMLKDFNLIGIPRWKFEKKFNLERSEIDVLEHCRVLKRVGTEFWKGYEIPVYSPAEFFKWEESDFREWFDKHIELIFQVRVWTKTADEIGKFDHLLTDFTAIAGKITYKNRADGGYYHYLTLMKYHKVWMPEHCTETYESGLRHTVICPDCGEETEIENLEDGRTLYWCENCGQEYEEVPYPF